MRASSLLMVILMLWSIPVLIYAILFFPELQHIVKSRVSRNRNEESNKSGNEMPFEYLLPMVAAATFALMFGLLTEVSGPVCLMLMGAGATLVGGVAFTLLQMHTLALSHETGSPDHATRHEHLDAARSAASSVSAHWQMLLKNPANECEPYPHHEDYQGSEGEDQGQLTSHLPGSTPFFEKLDVPIGWRIIRRFLAQKPHRLA
jgi:hypothetical protein